METNTTDNSSRDVIQIDIKRWFYKILSYWWLFALSLAISISCGYLYLRYTTFQYSARAVLLIKDAGRSGLISENNILVSDEGLSGGGKEMDNEIQILKSLSLMEKVVEKMGININYIRKGNFKNSELYTSTPILLDSFKLKSESAFGLSLFLEVEDYESFLLRFSEEEEEGVKCFYGVPFNTGYGEFQIGLNNQEAIVAGNYIVQIVPVEYVANDYRSKLMVERIGDQRASSVLSLSMLDPVPAKGADVLNTLIDIYNEEEINDKNKVLQNTITFIDERVGDLVMELDSVEGGIEQFKSSNEIITNNAASSMDFTLGEIRASVNQISAYEIQKTILGSLEKFLLQDKESFELIPANLIAENPVLSGLVNQFNNQVLQRDRLAVSASDKNPVLITLEEEMVDIRRLILQTIQNLKQDLQIPIEKIQRNIEDLKNSMKSVPSIEKRLLEKVRTQAIKENLFLFLLQKREETALSEAVTAASTRTIDLARAAKFAIYPKRKLTLMASGLIGFLIPLALIFLRSFFETRVESEDMVKRLTAIPILGRIVASKKKESIVVKSGNRSAINEMFRLLRTNLSFLNPNKKNSTYLVTSSTSGEGKSFIAINLGITLSLSNKKVILLGLDLRKPKMASYLGDTQLNLGVTNYLIGNNSLSEIVKPFGDNPNLSYISSGPIPPNPAELILSERMDMLMEELSKEYDYILIDSPPVGLVTDALLLQKFADNTLVVVRHQYTQKDMLKNLEDLHQKQKLKGAGIILNGIKTGGRYYGYGAYSYGYGYGEGYYTDEKS